MKADNKSCNWREKVKGYKLAGLLAQSVMCLTADPGVVSLTLAQSHTFVEIDHEIISTVILFLPLIQKGLLSVTSESMCSNVVKLAQEKVWLGELTISA